MEDRDIIKALEHDAISEFDHWVIDLINRQKAEIERLGAECGNQSALWGKHYESIFETAKETIKAEAVKEFAERLKKEKYDISGMYGDYIVTVDSIDNLVKEMVGEG